MAGTLSHDTPRTIHDDVKMGSELGFAAVFAVVLTAVGLWPLWHAGSPRWWLVAVAMALLVAALAAPQLLRPLNVVWFKLGMALSRIMTPVIMGLVFFLVVTPTALVMRARRADLLKLRFDPGAKSYWIERAPPGPDPRSMTNQF